MSAGPFLTDSEASEPAVPRPALAWGGSALLHAMLFAALALIPLQFAAEPPMGTIDTSWQEPERPLAQFDPAEVLFVTGAAPQDAGASAQAAVVAAPFSAPAAPVRPPTSAGQPVLFAMDAEQAGRPGGSLRPLLDAIGLEEGLGDGSGTGTGAGDGSGGGFFGVAAEGKRFVYVVDRSRSMNYPHLSEAKTRFRRLKLELVKSIGGMSEEQEFFIVYFNHEMLPMPANMSQTATYEAKRRYLYWMQSIAADGETNPASAYRAAMSMKPDVVYFLTDGSFTYSVERELLAVPQGGTVVHTYVFAELPGTPIAHALELLEQERPGEARKLLTRQQFQDARDLHRSRGVLRDIAKRNGGTFQVIP